MDLQYFISMFEAELAAAYPTYIKNHYVVASSCSKICPNVSTYVFSLCDQCAFYESPSHAGIRDQTEPSPARPNQTMDSWADEVDKRR